MVMHKKIAPVNVAVLLLLMNVVNVVVTALM
jgi:hypothetical protein